MSAHRCDDEGRRWCMARMRREAGGNWTDRSSRWHHFVPLYTKVIKHSEKRRCFITIVSHTNHCERQPEQESPIPCIRRPATQSVKVARPQQSSDRRKTFAKRRKRDLIYYYSKWATRRAGSVTNDRERAATAEPPSWADIKTPKTRRRTRENASKRINRIKAARLIRAGWEKSFCF